MDGSISKPVHLFVTLYRFLAAAELMITSPIREGR